MEHEQLRRLRGLLLKVAAALMFVVLVVGNLFVCQTSKACQESEVQRQRAEQQTEVAREYFRQSQINEIKALIQSSKALFLAHDELSALLVGVKAGKMVTRTNVPSAVYNQTLFNLQEIMYGIHEKNRLDGHGNSVLKIMFSPDKKILISRDGTTIKLWDAATGTAIKTLQSHSSSGVGDVTVSSDGTILAFGDGNIITLWDIVNNKEITSLHGHSAQVQSVAFSPDGTLLVSGSQDRIIVWDMETHREIITLPGHTKPVKGLRSEPVVNVRFSPDGRTLASFIGESGEFGVSGAIQLRNIEDGTNITIQDVSGGYDAESNFVFSPDSTLLAVGHPNEVTLWNVRDGSKLNTLQHLYFSVDPNTVVGIDFSPTAKLLASVARWGTPIKLWHLESGMNVPLLEDYHIRWIHRVTFSPDGRMLASASDNGTIKLWDVENIGDIKNTFQSHSGAGGNVSFSPDGTILAATGSVWRSPSRTITLWSMESALDPPQGGLDFVDTRSSDGTLSAWGNRDGTITLWNVAKGRKLTTLYGHFDSFKSIDPMLASDEVNSLTFSPDNTLLASGGEDNTIKLWNVVDGREIATLYGHTNAVQIVRFSPDGTLLASGSRETIKLWKVEDSSVIRTLYRDPMFGRIGLAFSPDGTLLASGSGNGSIKLRSIADGEEFMTLTGHSTPVDSLAFSPDGTLLASGSRNGSIKLWNVATGREISTLSGHSRSIQSITFSPDGQMLASANSEALLDPCEIKLWNVADGSKIIALHGHSPSIRFSPEGILLTPGSFELHDLLVRGCEWLHSYLKTNPYISETDRSLCDDIVPLNSGGYYYKQGKLDEAIAAFQKQLEITPDHADAWNNMGLALLKKGELDRALTAFQKQLEMTPDHADAWNNLGNTLKAQGKLHEALIAFQKQLEVTPDHRSVRINIRSIGYEFMTQGKLDEAIAFYQKLVERKPEYIDFWSDMGNTLYLQGKLDGAIVAYRQQLEKKPDTAEAWYNMGNILYKQGKWDEAITAYEKLLELTPDYADAWKTLLEQIGRDLEESGKLNEAVAVYRRLVEAKPDHGDAWYNMGRVLRQQGKLDEAIAAFQKQVEVKPEHDRAWSILGDSLQKQGKLDEALVALQKHVEVEPDAKWKWTGLAWQNIVSILGEFIVQGRLSDVIRISQPLSELRPEYEDLWSDIGLELSFQEKFDEALIAYQKQVELKSDHEWVWYAMGRVLEKQDKLDKAIAAYRKQVEITPDHKGAWHSIGDILQRQDNVDEALALYQRYIEVNPDDVWARVWKSIGDIFREQEDLDEALAAYQQQFVVDTWESMVGILGKLITQGRLNEVSAISQMVSELRPEYEDLWYDIGTALRYEEKFDEAIMAYQKQIEITPNHESAWHSIGIILEEQGKLDEAIAAYQKQIEVTPEHNSAWRGIGYILGKQGKLDEAIAAYQKLVENSPDNPWAWNTLCRNGSLWGYAADVINACEQAVMLAPESGYIRDSRGLARALTGNIDGAIEDFQAFVDWTYIGEKQKSQRQQWIAALRAGENPFTPKVLEELRLLLEQRPERPPSPF